MRGSEFVFDSIDLLHYNLHKISLNRGGSYIDYPKWLKKATIYIYIYIYIQKKNDDKCFQYSVTVTLNYKNIKKLSLLLHSIIGKRS